MATGEPRAAFPGLAHSRRAAILMILGFFATEMPVPYQAVALVALVPAAVESVRAIRLLSRDGAPRGTVVWSGVGLTLVLMLSGLVVLSVAASTFNSDYRDCLRGANTNVAVAQCKDKGGSGPLSGFLLNG